MISILIPIYNGINFIDDSVSSVLNQTYDKWELFIGVNGHPQNSPVFQIAKQYENKSNKIKVLDLHTIKGKSNALNEMVKYCNYNYVAILDVDDIWSPMKLELQKDLINKHDIIASNCIYFGEINGVVPLIPSGNISRFDFYSVNPIINSSSIIRRELCYWNPMWDGVEDYDLWLRLRNQNKTFYNFKEVLVRHRIHKESAFNSKGNNNKVAALLSDHSTR
jgi:glycosyltransferase involved in cell wall biosynthesis